MPLAYQVLDLVDEPAVPCISRVQSGLGFAVAAAEPPVAATQAMSSASGTPDQQLSAHVHGDRDVAVERAADGEQGVGEAQLNLGSVDTAAPRDIRISQIIDAGEQEHRAAERRQQVESVIVAPVEIVIHGARPGAATWCVRGGQAGRRAWRDRG